jgi:TfoX/Sxy family transcriptional regulator of competence genes
VTVAYDQELAARIRAHLAHRAGVTEKEMFGGIGFMLQGNMAVGVQGDDLMVRLDKVHHDDAIAEPHARAFAMGGRTMPGFILVAPAGTASDAVLGTWIDRAVAHAGTLPAKTGRATSKATKITARQKAAAKPRRRR